MSSAGHREEALIAVFASLDLPPLTKEMGAVGKAQTHHHQRDRLPEQITIKKTL